MESKDKKSKIVLRSKKLRPDSVQGIKKENSKDVIYNKILIYGDTVADYLAAMLLSQLGWSVVLIDPASSSRHSVLPFLGLGQLADLDLQVYSPQNKIGRLLHIVGHLLTPVASRFSKLDTPIFLMSPQSRRSHQYLVENPFLRSGRSALSQGSSYDLPWRVFFKAIEWPIQVYAPGNQNAIKPLVRPLVGLMQSAQRYWRPKDFAEANDFNFERTAISKITQNEIRSVQSLIAATTYVAPERLSYQQVLRAAVLLSQPILATTDSGYELKQFIKQKILEAKLPCQILEDTRVIGIERQKNGWQLITTHAAGVLDAQYCILGYDHYRVMRSSSTQFYFLDEFRKVEALYRRVQFEIVVDSNALPSGLERFAVWLNADVDVLSEENLIRCERLPKNETSNSYETLRVEFVVRNQSSSHDLVRLQKTCKRVLQRVCEEFPLIKNSIVAIEPDIRKYEYIDFVDSKIDLLAPPSARQLFVLPSTKEHQKMWDLSWASEYSNLFFSGAAVSNVLGPSGELMNYARIIDSIQKNTYN
jgi:hypothetical protein